MSPRSTAVSSEAKSPQVKYKGIHEPKGRVKGFRVEIRPSGSSTKIWVGTFDSRVKAMRAFDAAFYLTGKEPYYFVYPEGYFPPRPSKPSKDDVQMSAKMFAEMTGDLEVNVASCLVPSSKAGQTKNLGSEHTSQNTTVAKKVAEKKDPQLLSDAPLKTLAELDEYLQEAEYLDDLLDWTSLVEESKFDLEKSAYHRGFTSKLDIWKSLSDVPLPAPYDFPAIEDESFFLNFDTPLKVSSKRKRGVSQEIDPSTSFVENLGFSERTPADEDDWFSCFDSWV